MDLNRKRAMSSELSLNARKARVPLSGVLELTPRCTLDCKMCYVHLTEEQMGERRELTTEQWIKIIDDAVKMGMLSAQLTGGECLLHPGFCDIFLALKNRAVLTSVNTNATMLNDRFIDFFKKNPPNKIFISLYGCTEDGYERVTGHRVCERVKRSILRAKDAGLNLRMNISVSKYLYEETEQIIQFARENHLRYNLDMNMQPANEDTGRELEDFALTPSEIVEKYKQIMRMSGKEPIARVGEVEIPPLDTSGKTVKGMKCAAGTAKFMVHWDGTFSPCFWQEQGGLNIVDVGFENAWKMIVETANEYIRPIECETCKYRKICSDCAYVREDPQNKGHRNANLCKATIGKYMAGLATLKDGE